MAYRLAAAAMLALGASGQASAQPAAAPLPVVSTPGPAQATLPAPQIMQLVAPVALYPDPVLTDILAASTYPAQVVEAQRFLADPANAGLQGTALASAAASRGWDQSVQALLAFPPVLQMMDGRLEWTEQLGRAFIAQQADVMNAIQALRHQAQAAGTLRNGPQENVVDDGGDIAIYPPSQELVYLPAYDPACAYGPGPDCTAGEDYVAWDDGVFLPYGYWQWGLLDWPGRFIALRRGGFGERRAYGNPESGGAIWRHPPAGLFAESGSPLPSEHYNYAPPANQLPERTVVYARGALPPHTAAAPALRGPTVRAPQMAAGRQLSVSHGGGAIQRR